MGAKSLITIVWRYEVRAQDCARFEAAYGPSGEWAKLFGRSPEFRGTQLLSEADHVYLTLDRWSDRGAFDRFMAEYEADYRALDSLTAGWTRVEQRLGLFEGID